MITSDRARTAGRAPMLMLVEGSAKRGLKSLSVEVTSSLIWQDDCRPEREKHAVVTFLVLLSSNPTPFINNNVSLDYCYDPIDYSYRRGPFTGRAPVGADRIPDGGSPRSFAGTIQSCDEKTQSPVHPCGSKCITTGEDSCLMMSKRKVYSIRSSSPSYVGSTPADPDILPFVDTIT